MPQPSSDPADPLNWSAARKAGVLLVICLYPLFANYAGSVFGPALPVLAHGFNPPETFSNLTHLIAVSRILPISYHPYHGISSLDHQLMESQVPVLLAGASGLWWVPLANTYGRRPIMLVGLLITTVCSVWCAEAKTFKSLLAARLFQGIGFGPSDTVCADIVGEVFFVHQRGRAMAAYTFFLALGTSAGGLSGSYTAANLGWQWTMWIAAILAGTNFVLAVFFLPETLFDRESRLSQEEIPPSGSQSVDDKDISITELEHGGSYRPYTFSRSLAIGVNRGGLGRQLLGPWLSLRFPGVWPVVLLYGGLVGGVVTIATVAPTIVAMPPYLWGEKSSLASVGALVGAVLGAIYTYLTADWLMKRSAHGDEMGLAEPEARLPTMIPALFMATTGLWVFGFCAQNPGPGRWVGLEVGFGMVNFGIMQAPSVGFNYVSSPFTTLLSRPRATRSNPSAFLLQLGKLTFLPFSDPRRLPQHLRRRIRHERLLPLRDLICVDLFCGGVDHERRSRGALWHFRHAHGALLPAPYSAVDLRQANPYCDCEMATRGFVCSLTG